MRYSGLYFIPSPGTAPDASNNTLTAIINSIEAHFELATRQNQWTLVHRLLRSVPSNAAQSSSQPEPFSYQHILHLSYLSQAQTYCYIHTAAPSTQSQTAIVKPEPQSNAPTPQPSQPSQTPTSTSAPQNTGTIISIPASQSESHTSFLVTHLSPLWAFRHALQIPSGLTYTAGQFIIHIGELRASRSGPSSSATVSPGVVVCITTVATSVGHGGDDDVDTVMDEGYQSLNGSRSNMEHDIVSLDAAEEQIRALWDMIRQGVDFGKAEAREVMMGKNVVALKGEGEDEKEAVVRMWCEVLRLRG